uniref:Uncharacterized protein n=1 Tax=Strigamia maritima TaxID=126957 RepID=T1JJA6_STRMM
MLSKVAICLLASVLAIATAQRSGGRDEQRFSTQSSQASSPVTPVPILRQINEILEDGSYRFGYEGGDGSFRIETRQQDGTVQGKYGFRDADGQIRVVDYSATNETGFDAQGEHIPKGPPPARGRPDDFQDEIDYDEFTTVRPHTRRPTVPTTPRPRRTRPPTTKPRRRPAQQRPVQQRPVQQRPVQQFQQDFEIEQNLEDENQAFLLHGLQQSASHRPRRPDAPSRQNERPASQLPSDQLFLEPIPAPPPRSSTPVHQSNSGRVVARPVADSSFQVPRPRPQRPLRPQTQRTPTFEEFLDRPTNRPTNAPVRTRRPQHDPLESQFPIGLQSPQSTRHQFDDDINTARRLPQNRPSIIDDFQPKPIRPQRNRRPVTQLKTEFPKTRRPQTHQGSFFNEFETEVASPTPNNKRRPSQPSVEDVFDNFQTEPAPVTVKTRKPARRPSSQIFTHDTLPEDLPTQVAVPAFSRPIGTTHEIISNPANLHQSRPRPGRPDGSVIDDFLASVQREAPRPVAVTHHRPSFEFEEESRFLEGRQRRPQPLRSAEFDGAMGHTHGFVLQQRPAHHSLRSVNGPFVESAHLTQTVPGAPRPIVHNF